MVYGEDDYSDDFFKLEKTFDGMLERV